MSLVDLGREKDSLVAVDGLECVSAVCPTGCSTSLAILGNECLLRKQGATDEDQILGEFIQGVLNFIWRISGVGAEGQLEDLECSTDLFFSFAPTVQVNTAGFPGKKRFGGSGWLKMCVSCGSCRPQRLVCNLGE
jgi:hypothetical protein